MKVRNRRKEKIAARVLAILLIIAVVAQSVQGTGVVPVANAAEAEKTEKTDVLEKYGIIATSRSAQLYCSQADLRADIYAGKDFICSGTKVTVDGEVNAGGAIYPWCARFQASRTNPEYGAVSLPELRSRIEKQSDTWQEQDSYMN